MNVVERLRERFDAPGLAFGAASAGLLAAIIMSGGTERDPVKEAVARQIGPVFEAVDLDVQRKDQTFSFVSGSTSQECTGTYAQHNRIVIVNLGNVSCSQASV